MPRLPQPGSDNGVWGDILNDYLSQTLNSDGSLKNDSVGAAQLQDSSVTDAKVAPGAAIAQSKIANLATDLAGKAAISHTHTVSQISDSTPTGRSLLTAADATAAKTALSLTKADVGLGNVDNTSDATKNAATATLTNKTMSGSSNTFSSIPGSAIVSTDWNAKADTYASPTGGDILYGQTLNTHPEDSGFGFMPFLTNDLAYNIERNGTIAITLNGSTVTPANTVNAFYPDVSYFNQTLTATSDVLIVTVGMHTGRTWRYTNHVGVIMPQWLTAKDVMIEVYDTTASTWRTLATYTNTDPNATRGIFRANAASQVPSGNDITQLRFTITNFQSTAVKIRILSIFCINYVSGLLSDPFLPRGGGQMYGMIRHRSYTTAGRPSASTAGAGAEYFDTTLNKPVYSDGTNWRDASGTVV